MNLIEKILASKSGKKEVTPGDVVVADVDTLLLHDLSGYLTGRVLDKEVKRPILRPDRVCMVFDHHFSPASEERANVLQENRDFARRHGIRHFDCGSGNIHHVAIQKGFIKPGFVVVGSDSHTPVHGTFGAFATGLGNNAHASMVMPFSKAWFRVPETYNVNLRGRLPRGSSARDVAQFLIGDIGEGGAIYKAIEFTGEFVDSLDVSDQLLLPLLTIDIGAKTGYIDPSQKTIDYLSQWSEGPFELVHNDPDVTYARTLEYDVSHLEPQVACPPTVGNVKSVQEVAGTLIDIAEVGGHGGGRIDDIRMLAQLMRGHKVNPNVRLQVVPNSRWVFLQALREGLVEELYLAGANWFPAGAGSNQSANMGAMTARERMICSQARNFPGRNGSPLAEVYLASALTVAAAAIKGEIADPREFLE